MSPCLPRPGLDQLYDSLVALIDRPDTDSQAIVGVVRQILAALEDQVAGADTQQLIQQALRQLG